MQLSLLKTLFIIGTLVGVSMADYGHGYGHDYDDGYGYGHDDGYGYGHGYGKKYHRKGGVIKRTILIDGCTGKPVEKSYNIGGGGGGGDGGGGGLVIEDASFDSIGDPTYEPPTYPTEDGFDPKIFSYPFGYPAVDELVDDYDYLGGGDITDDELII